MTFDILMIYRKDSDERERNRQYITEWLKENIPFGNVVLKEFPDEVWHRTKYLNEVMDNSTADVIAFWDMDVVVNPDCVREGLEWLSQSHENVMYFPYGDIFADVDFKYFETIPVKDSFKNLGMRDEFMNLSPDYPSNGGVVLIKRQVYNKIRENENLVGWACDDYMRRMVVEKLGFKVKRADKKIQLFHISHPRFIDKDLDNKGWEEYRKMDSMTQEELIKYVLTNYGRIK